MSLKNRKIERLEKLLERQYEQIQRLEKENENLHNLLETERNVTKDGAEQIKSMIQELQEKQDKVQEEYEKIFSLRQDYELTVIEIKKLKDEAKKECAEIIRNMKKK